MDDNPVGAPASMDTDDLSTQMQHPQRETPADMLRTRFGTHRAALSFIHMILTARHALGNDSLVLLAHEITRLGTDCVSRLLEDPDLPGSYIIAYGPSVPGSSLDQWILAHDIDTSGAVQRQPALPTFHTSAAQLMQAPSSHGHIHARPRRRGTSSHMLGTGDSQPTRVRCDWNGCEQTYRSSRAKRYVAEHAVQKHGLLWEVAVAHAQRRWNIVNHMTRTAAMAANLGTRPGRQAPQIPSITTTPTQGDQTAMVGIGQSFVPDAPVTSSHQFNVSLDSSSDPPLSDAAQESNFSASYRHHANLELGQSFPSTSNGSFSNINTPYSSSAFGTSSLSGVEAIEDQMWHSPAFDLDPVDNSGSNYISSPQQDHH